MRFGRGRAEARPCRVAWVAPVGAMEFILNHETTLSRWGVRVLFAGEAFY